MLFISLAIACAVILAGLGLTSVIRRLFKVKGEASVLTDTALGAGGLSLVIFTFGVLQLYSGAGEYILGALCGLLAAAGVHRIINDIAEIRKNNQKVMGPKSLAEQAARWLPILLLVVIGCATLVTGGAPPVMDDWDSLAYHLTVPKLYIEHGGMYYIDFSSHSNFPMLVEMLYIPGLMLGNTVAAKLVHFIFGVMMVLAVIRLAEKHVKSGSGYLAGIIAAGIPIVLWEATTAYIDLAAALYTVLAADALLDMYDSKKYNTALVAGLCAGFAASTKLLGVAVVLFAGVWLLYISIQKNKKQTGRVLLWFMLGAAVCLPWYIRSFVYTGNPVYPFFYSIFEGRDWSQALADAYSASQARFGMGHGLIDLIMVPYNLTVYPERFYDTAGLFVGPILLIGIPMMLVMIKYRSKKNLGLAGFILVQVLLWFALTQQSRYLIPVFALLAALTAGLVYSSESIKSIKAGLWIVFTATAMFGLYTVVPLSIDRSAVAFGSESTDDYLRRSMDTYSATQYINENTPEQAKIALYGDTRGLYLDRKFAWADWGHNVMFSRDFSSTDELCAYLKSKGFTHALVNLRFMSKDHNGPLVAQAIFEGKFIRNYPTVDVGTKVGVYEIAK